MYKEKTKYKVVLMVVLALLLQIVGPVAQTVYGEVMESRAFTFEIVRQEDGSGKYEWSYNPEKAKGKTEFEINLKLKLTMDFSDLLIDSETGEEIGEFTISKDGILMARIYEVEEELEPEETPEEPEEEVEEEAEDEVEEAEEETEAEIDEDEEIEVEEEDEPEEVEEVEEVDEEEIEEDPEQEIEEDIVEEDDIVEEEIKDEADKIEITDIIVEFGKVIVTAKATGLEEDEKAKIEILNEKDEVAAVAEEVQVLEDQLIVEFDGLEAGKYYAKITIGEVSEVSEEFQLMEAEEADGEDEEIVEDNEEAADEPEEDLGDGEVSFFGKSVATLATAWGNLENLFLAEADPDEEPLEPSSGGGMIPFGFMMFGVGDGDLSTIDQFTYTIKLHDGTNELIGDTIDITSLEALGYEVEFSMENDFLLTTGDYLVLDISPLTGLGDFELGDDYKSGRIIFNEDESLDAASFEVDLENGTLTIIFDKVDLLNKKGGRTGFVSLEFSKSEESSDQPLVELIEFEDSEGTKTFVIKRENENASSITKVGRYLQNEDIIEWLIDVNTDLSSLNDAKVIDTIPEGLRVEKVEEIDLEVTTSSINPSGEWMEVEPNVTGSDIEISLGNLDRLAKRIKITTSFIDEDNTGTLKIANKARLTAEDVDIEVSYTLEFDRITGISKSGEIQETDNNIIEWTITFRGDSDSGHDSIVDTFDLPDNITLELIKESIELNGSTFFADNLDLTQIGDKVITFNNIPNKTRPQTLKYKTRIIYEGESIGTFTITNKATHNEKPIEAIVSKARGEILKKDNGSIYGDKNGDTFIDWKIEVNKNNEKWRNVTITENVPNGFSYIKVSSSGGKTWAVENENTNEINIKIDTLHEKDILTVTTKLEDKSVLEGDIENVTNNATIGWYLDYGDSIIGTGGEGPFTDDISGAFTKSGFNHNISKKVKSIDYKDKIIEWEIDYKTYNENVNGLIIEDNLVNSHKYDEDIQVKLNGSPLTEDTGFTLNDKTDTRFKIIINKEGSDKYNNIIISYKTIFDLTATDDTSGDVKNLFENNAKATKEASEITASATQEIETKISNNGSKSVKKEDGDNRIFNWEVKLNYKGKTIEKSQTIRDLLEGRQKYIKESIKIYKAELNENGVLEKVDPESLIENYDIEYFEKNDSDGEKTYYVYHTGMEISFVEDLAFPIILEYQTEAVGISEQNYKNKVSYNNKDYEAGITYDQYNNFVYKELLNDRDGKVVKGDILKWELVVNKSLSEIHDFVLKDKMSQGLVFIENSLNIYEGAGDDKGTTPIDLDNEGNADGKFVQGGLDGSENGYKLTKDLLDETYTIEYETLVYAEQISVSQISNDVYLEGYSLNESKVGDSTFNLVGRSQAGGTAYDLENEYKVKIVKKDNGNEKISANVIFNLITVTTINGQNYISIDEFTTDSNGEFTLDLTKNSYNTYYIQETGPPTGYKIPDNLAETVIGDESLKVREVEFDTEKEFDLEIVNDKIIDIKVKKVWIGPGDSTDGAGKVTFILKANGDEMDGIDPITLETNDGKNWTYTFKDLPFYDDDGEEIEYTIEEADIENYVLINDEPTKKNIDEHGNYTLEFRNWNQDDKVSIPVEKVWRVRDEVDTLAVTIKLYADGVEDTDKTIVLDGTETEPWKATFTNLLKYNSSGDAIKYTIKEEFTETTLKFNKSIDPAEIYANDESALGTGFKVTNVELMDVKVTKVWAGGNDNATVDSISIQLKKGDTIVTISKDTWEHTFNDIPRFEKDSGEEIDYTVTETPNDSKYLQHGDVTGDVDNGFTITNIPLTDITVTKEWIGPIEPGDEDEIKINLYKTVDGTKSDEPVETKAIKDSTTTEYIFKNKPLYEWDEDGGGFKPITYSIEEEIPTDLSGEYAEPVITGTSPNFKITNKNITKIDVKVNKVWWVSENSHKKEVTIKLLKGVGKEAGTIDLDGTETEPWTATFTNLLKYDVEGENATGDKIIYYVDEEDLESSIKFMQMVEPKDPTSQETEFTITNIELMDIEVEKKWIGTPGASVTVTLYEVDGDNESQVGDSKTITGDTWKTTFEGIPKYKANGDEITYIVKEDVPTGYEQEGDIAEESVGNGIKFTITNRQVVDITATKIWDGGKYNRPGEDIYFQLYRTDYTGGDEVKEPVKLETEDENGKVVVIWENLEATDEDGKEYTYYVKEVLKGEDDTFTEISDANPLANYKVSYGKTEGEYSLEVTNTYIIPTDGEVTAIKNWEGGDAGNRPEIWFKLYRQVETEPSEPVPEAEVKQPTNENNWEVTWINLEKTDIDGNTYTFSVKEGYYDDGDKWIEIDHDNTLQNYTVTYDGLEVTNTYESPRINVKVTKNWINGENHRPSSIEVELYRSTDEDAENPTQLTEKTISLSNSEGWTHTWTELEETDYDGKKYYYSVKEVPLDNYNSKVTGDMEDGFTITNTYVIPSDGEVTANKVWKGGELPRPTIWFKLFRQVGEGQAEPAKVLDGSERAEIKELADETIEVTWTDLEERDEQGNKYTFSVREVNEDGTDLDWMPEGYYKDEEELTVTNTKEGTIWVDVKKVWENVETPGPEVTIKLYSQKESETEPQDTGKEIKLNTVNSWEGSFDGLDQYDTEGKPITYTVKEAEVPEGYTERYDNNGNRWTITNTKTAITPEKMTIEAIKEWAGGSVGKPDIWFKLLRESYFHRELTQAGDIKQVPSTTSGAAITVTWDNMDKTDEYGNEYTYFVREVDKDGKDYTPANYVKTENELKVTNHYVSPQDASAKATKEWIYGPSERPTTWFKLYRKVEGGDLEQVPDADIIILPNGTTEVIWTGLTKTDSNGKEYSFSVKEVDHDGNDYTPENYEKSEDGLTITNTYVIPKTNITATKVWSGGSSNKPTIELQLYRQLEGEDKEAVGDSVELKDGETEHTWEDLDATDEDGNEYTYTVDEVSVPTRYRKSISVDGLTITNTYSPPYTPPSGGGGTPPPKEEEPEEPTEPEQPEEPEEPEEPEKPTEPEKPDEPKKPFSFLIFEDPEEDPEGDPEDGPIVKQIIETPVIFREPGDEDNPSNRIRYNPKTKRIEVDDLEDDEEVEVIVTTTIEDEEIVVGKLKIRKGKDGEPVIEEELIDPYGTIRDSETNDPVGDVELKIYFADTPRNRENGRTPGTLVNLPVVPGFTPNDNRNPQISVHELVWSDETGDHGNYAWLVFPKTDYYIVAKRTGYEDYTSPTISVEYDIIKHDITMLSTDGDGTLPKTGEGSHLPFYIIGLVMIVLGYMTRKRKIA